MPDFTGCKRLFGNAYAGANGKKIGIEYQGEQYMLKFPPSGTAKRTELSYTNSCLSEHIASTIFNMGQRLGRSHGEPQPGDQLRCLPR